MMERTSFPSGGQTIAVTAWPATAPEGMLSPAILLLHGAGGVEGGNHYVSQLATAISAQGFTTFVVEYFHRTGTVRADDATIYAHFLLWLETLQDGLTFIAHYPGVDAARIGVFGYSLGGYLAVALGSLDARVRAVGELAGGIDADFARSFRRLPPLLIVHGDADQRVPFARGVELEQFAHGLGGVVETAFFPGEGHVLSLLAARETLARTVHFFRAHLAAGDQGGGSRIEP